MHHSMRGQQAQSRKLLAIAVAAEPTPAVPPRPPEPAAISASSTTLTPAIPPLPYSASPSEKRLKRLTKLILTDLAKDSIFMQENDQRDIPTFTPEGWY
jgi:hypothetical protein